MDFAANVLFFSSGNILNFHDRICDDSELDAFLIIDPPFLEKEQMSVQLADYRCNIAGVYPLFSSEFGLYEKLDLERFWKLPNWDPLNVSRQRLQ